MKHRVDLAIVGSGFAGSLLAMIARKLERSVVLLERQRHPRFAIGESSTPLANLLLEELAGRYDLGELLPFTKWGSWQRQRPDVRCGLKRGFSFFHHAAGELWQPRPDRGNELLVAASPRDDIADTHWYRPDFDHAFARMAVARGATLIEDAALDAFEPNGHGEAILSGRTPAGSLAVTARFVVDASGPRGFLSRALTIPEIPVASMPNTEALYTHFTGVRRWEESRSTDDTPPYPPDDAALHHVFDRGWIWVLRFAHGVTSAGVAATNSLARELKLEEGAAGWGRLLARFPSIAEQFTEARPCQKFHHQPQLTYRVQQVAGSGWALLPSAAGFVDPLLSTGFPLTLLGVDRLARSLAEDWGSPRWDAGLERYAAVTRQELDRTATLIGALYRHLNDFEMFSRLSLLYFAAASYTESARRLGCPERAAGFLLPKHPGFAPAFAHCVEQAELIAAPSADPKARLRLLADLDRAIEPVDIAGFLLADRRNWHPARAEDVLKASEKFGPGIDRPAVEAMLRRSGF